MKAIEGRQVLLAQIFHGKQALSQTKNELLQAKRESRALRRAKLKRYTDTHIKNGQFAEAFCAKAIERTEWRLIHDMVQSSIEGSLLEVEQPLSQDQANKQKSSVPFNSSKSSSVRGAAPSEPMNEVQEAPLPQPGARGLPGQQPHAEYARPTESLRAMRNEEGLAVVQRPNHIINEADEQERENLAEA